MSHFHRFKQCINGRAVFVNFSTALNEGYTTILLQPIPPTGNEMISLPVDANTCLPARATKCAVFQPFSTQFAFFLKNIHNVVIDDLCTSPLPSLRRLLEMKMHYRKHVSCKITLHAATLENYCLLEVCPSGTVAATGCLKLRTRLYLQELSFFEQDSPCPESIYSRFCSIRSLMFCVNALLSILQ